MTDNIYVLDYSLTLAPKEFESRLNDFAHPKTLRAEGNPETVLRQITFDTISILSHAFLGDSATDADRENFSQELRQFLISEYSQTTNK